MGRKFNTSYGTAGGGSYGYKSKAEAKRARSHSKKIAEMASKLSKEDLSKLYARSYDRKAAGVKHFKSHLGDK